MLGHPSPPMPTLTTTPTKSSLSPEMLAFFFADANSDLEFFFFHGSAPASNKFSLAYMISQNISVDCQQEILSRHTNSTTIFFLFETRVSYVLFAWMTESFEKLVSWVFFCWEHRETNYVKSTTKFFVYRKIGLLDLFCLGTESFESWVVGSSVLFAIKQNYKQDDPIFVDWRIVLCLGTESCEKGNAGMVFLFVKVFHVFFLLLYWFLFETRRAAAMALTSCTMTCHLAILFEQLWRWLHM